MSTEMADKLKAAAAEAETKDKPKEVETEEVEGEPAGEEADEEGAKKKKKVGEKADKRIAHLTRQNTALLGRLEQQDERLKVMDDKFATLESRTAQPEDPLPPEDAPREEVEAYYRRKEERTEKRYKKDRERDREEDSVRSQVTALRVSHSDYDALMDKWRDVFNNDPAYVTQKADIQGQPLENKFLRFYALAAIEEAKENAEVEEEDDMEREREAGYLPEGSRTGGGGGTKAKPNAIERQAEASGLFRDSDGKVVTAADYSKQRSKRLKSANG